MSYLSKLKEEWNSLETFGNGGGNYLEPGWQSGILLDAKETVTPWGDPSVTFFFDIVEGKFAHYFGDDFKEQSGEKKWRGTLEQSLKDNGAKYFKGLITAIEESNPGYKFDFDLNSLKKKKIGIGFRREFYMKDGQEKSIVKAFTFRDVAKIADLEPPKDFRKKSASASAVGYTSPSYTPPPPMTGAYTATAETAPKFEAISEEEDLPF